MSDQKPISVLMWSKKKRIFKATPPSAPKISPALFDDGTVGLRIVAAMSGVESGRPVNEKAKSDPIPIQANGVGPILKLKMKEEEEEGDDVELSESYTCVISRERGGTVRKRVYLGDGLMVVDGIDDKFEMNPGAFSDSPAATGGFLSCCCLRRKKLHGLDIFIHRGDKAFCSVECRCKQILSDEREEKCWSNAEKTHESPLSPYLAPLPFGAGVAAA